MLGMFVAMLK